MIPQKVTVLAAQYLNHDVKRFVLDKPEGFQYQSGDNVQVAINKEGWQTEFRPFTFTSLNEWPYLELIIKIYDDRDGVTHQLGKINAGAELLLGEVFGSIHYKGPGIFLAGGSGITPFISIFRQQYMHGSMKGNKLILSNKTAEDIILPYELNWLLKDNFLNVFTRQGVIGFMDRRIDRRMLIRMIGDFGTNFYVCGPPKFVKQITTELETLGADPEVIIFEKELG